MSPTKRSTFVTEGGSKVPHSTLSQHEDNNNKTAAHDAEAAASLQVLRRLQIATALCIVFLLVEVIGGYLAGSLAVLSDAAHLLSDATAFAVAIVAHYLAHLPSTVHYTYGLRRVESLAAFFSMATLAIVCVVLGTEAIRRLYVIILIKTKDDASYIEGGGEEVDGPLMSMIAAMGVVVNLILAVVLGEHHVHLPGHSHDHSHDHGGCGGHGHEHKHDHHEGAQLQLEDVDSAASSCCGADHSRRSAKSNSSYVMSHNHVETDHLMSHEHCHPCSPDISDTESIANPDDDAVMEHHAHAHGHSKKDKPQHWNELTHDDDDHDHHDDEEALAKQQRQRNVNLHAAYLHVLGDLAQSVAVLIAGLLIWWRPAWVWIDPVCTLAFCIVVFYSTTGVIRQSISVLLEQVPMNISWQAVHDDLNTKVKGLTNLHDVHIWCISDGVPCISLHASVAGSNNGQDENVLVGQTLLKVTTICRSHGIRHITAQIQPARFTQCLSCCAVTSKKCHRGGSSDASSNSSLASEDDHGHDHSHHHHEGEKFDIDGNGIV